MTKNNPFWGSVWTLFFMFSRCLVLFTNPWELRTSRPAAAVPGAVDLQHLAQKYGYTQSLGDEKATENLKNIKKQNQGFRCLLKEGYIGRFEDGCFGLKFFSQVLPA